MSISLGLVLAFVLQAPGAAVSPWRVVGQCEPLAGDVERFVVSPDGARAATAGEDGRVVLWDVERRAEIARYDGAGDHGALLAFSDDSKLLAAHVPHWRPDTFRVWSSTDGKELTGWSTIPLGPGTERSDRDLGVWREGAELHLHEGGAALFHPSDFQSLHVSSTRILGRGPQCTERRFAIVAGGRQVVVARVSGCVGGRVPDGRREDELDLGWYAVDGGAELARFHWVEQQPESNPCPGDQLAVTADEVAFPVQGVVRVYGLDGKERARFASGVRALVDFGAQRVTGHADGSVAFWDGAKRVARVQALAGPVRGLKHDDGRVLVEGGGRYALIDRERRLFGPVAAQEGRVFERITLLRDSEGRFSCHEDARLLRILSTTSWIYDEYDRRNVPCEVRDARAWFVDGGRLLSAGLDEVGAPFAIGSHRAAIQDVQFGPVGVLVSSRRAARVLDASGVLVGEPVPSAAVAWLGGVASRVDGGVVHARAPWTRAASAPIHAVRIEGRVRVTLAGGAVEEVELGRPGAPLALSPDGGRIACAWRPDGASSLQVRVLELPSKRPAWSATLPLSSPEFLDFDPSGRRLAVRNGHRVHVFDEQGKLSFETSSGPATMSEDARHRSFGWTADGRKFVTVSHAGLVEVRDATDGRVLLAFEAPDECYGHFARLHVAPDGERFVASYSEVELAYVWSASEGRAGELRIPTESAGEPVAWLAADELAVATPRGVDVLALGASTTSRIDGTGPGADVYADSASGRLAIVQEAHLTLVERR